MIVTYTAEEWICGDATVMIDATVTAHISDIQVTLVDATCISTNNPLSYWQRAALIDWVACHQYLLRRVCVLYGDPGYAEAAQ